MEKRLNKLNKEEKEILTGLALRFGVGIIPQAVEAIEGNREREPQK